MTRKEFEQLSPQDIANILEGGGRFVVFTYTISIILMTFRRSSDVFLLRYDETAFKHGYPYFIISFLLGWWGIPWGPIYTVQSLFYSFKGKDITEDILSAISENESELG